MADKHGPIFSLTLGLNQTLVVSSSEIAKECLTTNDRIFATRPNIAAGRYIGYDNAFFALAPYGQYWRDMRKLATLHLLSNHRLELLKHVRDTEIYSFIKDLHSLIYTKNSIMTSLNQIVPISKLIEHMTFNISTRMIAGKRFSGTVCDEEESDAWRLKNAIKAATYLSGVFVMEDAIPWLGWIDFQGHVRSMKETATELDYVFGKWLDEHLKKNRAENNGNSNGDQLCDFMDVMISNLAEYSAISGHTRDTVIKATSLTLVLTASGSTAITLTWALSLLLNNPIVLQRAQEDLDIHVGQHKWVQESDIQNLKYLQAIIKETLRLYPPAPLTGIREAMEDCFVAGYNVRKGTRLLVNIWKLQRDPSIWPNPNEFQPERFMTTHEDIDFRGPNLEYIPFSSGRRSCPGMTFGLQVVHLTLARLIQGFHIKTKDGVLVDMSEGLGVAMPKLKPLEVVLKARLPLELYQSL
ncbi:putative Cytochrome P450 [Quillaja saponaria]|uniref:Cytochrome P450 n=1 Tax=Quillaja saponaria TaxID=32244 RepID=A0AAD7L2T6_QUISA|nr:putative Cytochrome P450 [Quillaja saponaria]